MNKLKHVFAFYKEDLPSLANNNELHFKDSELWNRLVKIVRIQPGDKFILFDEQTNITATCLDKTLREKREIFASINSHAKNVSIEPKITFYLPLLKKETFEYAIYVSAQMGIYKIIPIITEKSDHNWHSKNESERLKKIMISACEQLKNFVLPIIEELKSIKDILTSPKANKIYFDTEGKSITLLQKTNEPIEVIIGPEGGFTQVEEKLIYSAGFESYRLTKTVLRSKEAIVLGLGILSSN